MLSVESGRKFLGFFAGFVVLDGFQVDSTKSITTSETTSYRVTGYANEINDKSRCCCCF